MRVKLEYGKLPPELKARMQAMLSDEDLAGIAEGLRARVAAEMEGKPREDAWILPPTLVVVLAQNSALDRQIQRGIGALGERGSKYICIAQPLTVGERFHADLFEIGWAFDGDPVAAGLVSEAWMATRATEDMDKGPMPSKDPSRQEAVIIGMRSIDGRCATHIGRIEHRGTKIHIAEWISDGQDGQSPAIEAFFSGYLSRQWPKLTGQKFN